MKTRLRISACMLLLIPLLACSGGEQQELRAWMQQERDLIQPEVTPIPEPKKFAPHAYGGEKYVEPFSNDKLEKIFKSGQPGIVAGSALIDPELRRRKQPLEAFPLDAMSMVGMLNRKGQIVALVKVDSLLYQVGVGSYLGQNYGRIVKIEEDQVVLREIVQDAAGEWIERPAALQLQEESSK
jgi:type IV pilus assembly protein PilP